MGNRRAYLKIFYIYLFIIFFLLKISHLLWNHFVTQNVMINIFYPPAHLKRQIDVLCDKMGIDDAPKVSDLKKGFINIIQIDSIQKQPPEVFYKKEVFKNFAKFTGKHLYHSLFLNKVATLRPATLLKRGFGAGVFCEFCEIFKRKPVLRITTASVYFHVYDSCSFFLAIMSVFPKP